MSWLGPQFGATRAQPVLCSGLVEGTLGRRGEGGRRKGRREGERRKGGREGGREGGKRGREGRRQRCVDKSSIMGHITTLQNSPLHYTVCYESYEHCERFGTVELCKFRTEHGIQC